MSGRDALVAELRPHVADERVLAAIAGVPRELFVPAAERHRAWENSALGIGAGQTISQPLVVARMCELLALRPGERVLEIGTGSGYHAAVLVALGVELVSVERHAELSRAAAAALAAAGVEGVELVVGDGRRGHPERAPYDAISVTATAERELPRALLDQLGEGGRLVAPLRAHGAERLVLVTRRADGSLDREELEQVRFVPLV